MEKLVARLALLLVALLSISCSRPSEAFDEISWQGEKYRLSRTFESWEDYKKASEQLAAHERARVYAKAISIPVPQSFQSHEALVHGFAPVPSASIATEMRSASDGKGSAEPSAAAGWSSSRAGPSTVGSFVDRCTFRSQPCRQSRSPGGWAHRSPGRVGGACA